MSPIGRQASRAYSSEMANALVQVSQNMGMGSAAIGLGGAGIGIGLVFASLLSSVARNPSLRGQLFSYAILGFAFVEAIGLVCERMECLFLYLKRTLTYFRAVRPDGCHDVQVCVSKEAVPNSQALAAAQHCISKKFARA